MQLAMVGLGRMGRIMLIAARRNEIGGHAAQAG
jgi:6-phosphogluconate dehydrogenase (decarboxylating)